MRAIFLVIAVVTAVGMKLTEQEPESAPVQEVKSKPKKSKPPQRSFFQDVDIQLGMSYNKSAIFLKTRGHLFANLH